VFESFQMRSALSFEFFLTLFDFNEWIAVDNSSFSKQINFIIIKTTSRITELRGLRQDHLAKKRFLSDLEPKVSPLKSSKYKVLRQESTNWCRQKYIKWKWFLQNSLFWRKLKCLFNALLPNWINMDFFRI